MRYLHKKGQHTSCWPVRCPEWNPNWSSRPERLLQCPIAGPLSPRLPPTCLWGQPRPTFLLWILPPKPTPTGTISAILWRSMLRRMSKLAAVLMLGFWNPGSTPLNQAKHLAQTAQLLPKPSLQDSRIVASKHGSEILAPELDVEEQSLSSLVLQIIGSTRLKTNLGRCEKISTSAVCPFCVTWAPNRAPLPMR